MEAPCIAQEAKDKEKKGKGAVDRPAGDAGVVNVEELELKITMLESAVKSEEELRSSMQLERVLGGQ